MPLIGSGFVRMMPSSTSPGPPISRLARPKSPFNEGDYVGAGGWPSIRTKALSRRSSALQCCAHRVVARAGWRTKTLAFADQGHPRAALDTNDLRIRLLRAQH